MKLTLKKSLFILLNIVLISLIVLMTVFITTVIAGKKKGNLSNLFGYSPVVVVSDSMKGKEKTNFSKGDLIFIKKVDATTLKEKDVVSFYDIINGERQLNTHRIIKVETSGSQKVFTTKGDNTTDADESIRTQSDIVGSYSFKIKGAGHVVNFLSSKWGFLFCFVLPMLAFFLWRLVKLISDVLKYKNSNNDGKPEV